MKKYRYCPCGIRIEYPKIRCIACKQERELREIQKTAKAHKDLYRELGKLGQKISNILGISVKNKVDN